jgi:hypothetical protein
MNETNKLDASQVAELEHLKQYLNDIATVTQIAVEAGANLDIYNNLCTTLKSRSRGLALLHHVA